MDQVTEHQHLLGAKAGAEREQAIEVSLVTIARKRDALGLKALGFTEVQIGQEQELFNSVVITWLARNLGSGQPHEQPWA